MQFNFGGINQQTPENFPQPSIYNYFAEQSARAGYMGPDLGTIQREFIQHYQLPHHFYPHPFHLPYPHDMCEAIQREIEKERIRGEIIKFEIAGMRDLMMWNGLAPQMGCDGFPSGSSTQMEPMGLPLSAKPEEDISGSKSKAVSPSIIDPSEHLLQKTRKEWSCALCKIIAPDKKSLNQHLHGKKHKLKEAALRAEGGGENCRIGLYPMKVTESVLVVGTIDPIIKEGGNSIAESLLLEKNVESSLKEQDLPPLQDDLNLDDLKNHSTLAQKVEWSSAIRQDIIPKEQELNECLQGNRHKEATVKNWNVELSPMMAAKSVQFVGTIDSSTEEGVKFTAESFLLEKTGEESLKEQDVPPLQENLNSDELKKNWSAVVQKEWTCFLCQVSAPTEHVLNSHLQGKKHKKAVLRALGGGKNCSIGLSPLTATKSIQVAGIIDPTIEEEVNSVAEYLLLERNVKASLKEQDLPPLQDNRNMDDLKNQSTLAQKVEWSSDICQDIIPNELELNECLQGNRHKVATVKNWNVQLSPVMAAKSVQVVGTIDSSTEEGVKFTAESLLLEKTGEESLKEQDVPPLQENLNSDELKKNWSAVVQKEWTCYLCQVSAPTEHVLNSHLQGKKHNKAVLRALGGGKNCSRLLES